MPRLWALLALGGVVATGCGSTSRTPADRAELMIFAATSLTDAFGELGTRFEKEHPRVSIRYNFAASSELAFQIEQGAHADVFASADQAAMRAVEARGAALGRPRLFAHNELAVAVPRTNPGNVSALSDLEEGDLVVSLCTQRCPAGRYALEVFDNAGLDVEADSLEPDVRAVLTRVRLGEVDAGVVYTSDVVAAEGAVRRVRIPSLHNVTAAYPIVTLEGAPREAKGFVDLVLSPPGQRVLREHGFLPR